MQNNLTTFQNSQQQHTKTTKALKAQKLLVRSCLSFEVL